METGNIMTVIVLDNPSAEARGKLRRYCCEIKPNVFCGTISSRVRQTITDLLSKSGIDAMVIYSDQTESGYSVDYCGHGTKHIFKDFDGVLIPAIIKDRLTLSDVHARPGQKILDHLVDVGALSESMIRGGRAAKLTSTIYEIIHQNNTNVTRDEVVNFISFLCASHDIGKIHPAFQNSLAEADDSLSARLTVLGLRKEQKPIRHERLSAVILTEFLKGKGFSPTKAKEFSYITAYHHQGKPGTITETIDNSEALWVDLQDEAISLLFEKWPFTKNVASFDYWMCGIAYSILSLMTISDWITSSDRWRQSACINDVQKKARTFIEQNHLGNQTLQDTIKTTWNDVFPFQPNGLQSSILNRLDASAEFVLIEAPCGVGKTEAGIAAALRIGGKCGGMYFAMPTITTAHAMAERLRILGNKIGLAKIIPEFDSSYTWTEDMTNTLDPDTWTASPRFHMLYPYAVGTVDQVIKTICQYKYADIGILGLSDKVLVFDEVHAYDEYMLTETETLLRWCRYMRVPVVMLSASLPSETRKRLLRVYGADGKHCSDAYPLVTSVAKGQITELSSVTRGKTVGMRLIHSNDPLEDMEKASIAATGCTAVITTTVDESILLYDRLKKRGANVYLYHSRDTIDSKEAKIDLLLKLFGKDKTHRPKQAILVSTAIIEQSLDIDMDNMITALCPIDLLIQRMGRKERHDDKGTVREATGQHSPIMVVSPADKTLINLIYDKGVIERSESVLKGIHAINTIDSVRPLLDAVYTESTSPKAATSAIKAASSVLPSPDMPTALACDAIGVAYDNYRSVGVETREVSYPTMKIAICDNDVPDDRLLQKRLYRSLVVSVALSKLRGYDDYQNGIGLFDDVRIYKTAKSPFILDSEKGLIENASTER